MADAKPQELASALIDAMCIEAVGGPHHWHPLGKWTKDTTRTRIRAALLLLGIPTAALNALVRGEAVVVPRTRTREMCDARQDVHGFSPLTDQTWAKLCAIRACGETGANGDAEWSAMLAASPYAAKE